MVPFCLGLCDHPHRTASTPIQDGEQLGRRHREVIKPFSVRLGRVDAETNTIGTSFGVVRQTLCATALVGDLVIPCVGLAESVDELGEEGDGGGRVGHDSGIEKTGRRIGMGNERKMTAWV